MSQLGNIAIGFILGVGTIIGIAFHLGKCENGNTTENLESEDMREEQEILVEDQ